MARAEFFHQERKKSALLTFFFSRVLHTHCRNPVAEGQSLVKSADSWLKEGVADSPGKDDPLQQPGGGGEEAAGRRRAAAQPRIRF